MLGTLILAATLSTNDPIAIDISQRLQKALSGHPAQTPALKAAPAGRDFDGLYRTNGTPRQIRGEQLQPAVHKFAADAVRDDLETARTFFRENRRALRLNDPDTELVASTASVDDDGRALLRFSQRYRGLEVWPSELLVHTNPRGDIDLVEGAYVPTPRRVVNKPQITADSAKQRAANDALAGEAELLIYARAGSRPRLAWKVSVFQSLAARWLVFIDAATGAELTRYNTVETSTARGSGRDLGGTTRTLDLWLEGPTYYMLNATKKMFDTTSQAPSPQKTRGGIFVADAGNQPASSEPKNFPPGLAVATSGSANSWNVPDTVSAAVWIGETYDYYLERHNRNSIDGNGGSLTGIVRLGQRFPNAFWDDEQQFMVFGDDDSYAGSLDVIAHEMTHGVTSHTAKLVYKDQSGALNEAMSDIFGEMAEARTFGSNDWIIGSQLRGKIRNMANPAQFGDPAKMSQFLVTTQDNGGVHTNSGIINRAYYLLAAGLPGAIGNRDAEKIFYRALTQHLTKDSQFIDARIAAVTSAQELFGTNSVQAAKTGEAFDAVEIFAAPPVPDQPSIPVISGTDSTLFVFKDNASWFLGRKELPSDGTAGAYLSHFDVAQSRPSVSADGTLAAFVDSINDMCLIRTDGSAAEVCLDLPKSGIRVSSTAMSPDGNKFAFVLMDAQKNPDNKIIVVDLGTNQQTSYQVDTPTYDGTSVTTIDYADAMAFTHDGQFLLFDAFNELTTNGQLWGAWSIYAIALDDATTYGVIPPDGGYDFGFPALGHTSDDLLTFEAYDAGAAKTYVIATNLDNGDLQFVGQETGAFAAPSYTGDDRAIVYGYGASNASGSSVAIQQLAADHLTPSGNPAQWLSGAAYPVIYRRGTYSGPTTQPGSLSFSGAAFNGNEGSAATITVVRLGGNKGTVSVSYSTANGSATSSDYAPASGTLTWADGDSDPKTFRVTLLSDTQSEGTETVSLRLSSPTNGATLGSPSTATLNIANVTGTTTTRARRRPSH